MKSSKSITERVILAGLIVLSCLMLIGWLQLISYMITNKVPVITFFPFGERVLDLPFVISRGWYIALAVLLPAPLILAKKLVITAAKNKSHAPLFATMIGMVFGVAPYGLSLQPNYNLSISLTAGLVVGLVYGFLTVMGALPHLTTKDRWMGVFLGLGGGAVFGIITDAVYGPAVGLAHGWVWFLTCSLAYYLVVGPIYFLIMKAGRIIIHCRRP